MFRINTDLIQKWLSYVDVSKKSQETYTKAISKFHAWTIDNTILEPSRQDLLDYRDSLIRQGLKPATVQVYVTALKLLFGWLDSEGIYPNVAINLKSGVCVDRTHKRDNLTTSQVCQVLSNIDRITLRGKRDYAIILLAVTTGLRTIEIVRANIDDIGNIGNDVVLYIQGKGKSEKSEYVKLSYEVETAIQNYLMTRKRMSDSEPLFAGVSYRDTASGGRLRTESISRIIKQAFRKVGLNSNRLTAHSLRHTAATINLMSGATLEETQQLLRHTNFTTTLIYSHAIDRVNNKSEERITNAIFRRAS